jgi:hypothetical protein
MNGYHWTGILVLLVIGYFLGVFFPAPGMALRGKVGV